MIILIQLDGNDIEIAVKEGDKFVAKSSWHGEYTLSERLLGKIDELLTENGFKKEDIVKVETRISETTGVTSRRIVESVAQAWNVGVVLASKGE